jgi:transcriptional regulator with XRE-family HTH domain
MTSPLPTDVNVGRRIRMRRLMMGITQEKLAGRVGLTFQQIQKYESGKNRVSASRLQQFANILQVPVSFFFEGATNASINKPSLPDFASKFLANSEGLALADAFMKIKNRALRRSIVNLLMEMESGGF